MAASSEAQPEYQIPPASFSFLVESILMQTQMQLGLLNFGQDEPDEEPDLAMARHSIDMLAMLGEKTRGNLSTEEQRLLENGLTELRFRYVQVANELKSSGPAASLTDDVPRIITADGGKGSKTE